MTTDIQGTSWSGLLPKADAGDSEAMFSLALMSESVDQAIHWIEKSAVLKHLPAIRYLINHYTDFDFKDTAKADYWIKLRQQEESKHVVCIKLKQSSKVIKENI
jgi:hypothetical protein